MASENEPPVVVTILYGDSYTQPIFINDAPASHDAPGEENQIYIGDNLAMAYKNGVWRHWAVNSGPFPYDP